MGTCYSSPSGGVRALDHRTRREVAYEEMAQDYVTLESFSGKSRSTDVVEAARMRPSPYLMGGTGAAGSGQCKSTHWAGALKIKKTTNVGERNPTMAVSPAIDAAKDC